MDNNYFNVVGVLAEISSVLSELSDSDIELLFTGATSPCEGDICYELEDVEIPSDLISEPYPKCPHDKSGYYIVNRIRLRDTINDCGAGYKFTSDEIKKMINGIKTWGYCPKQ